MRKRASLSPFPVLLAATLATACGDAIGPEMHVPDAPALQEAAAAGGRISGVGTLGSGPPEPGSGLFDFDFDVASDLTGRLFFRAWAVVRPDGTPATITVAPADPGTAITAFRGGSAACDDPAQGAEFDGIGRLDTGELYGFTVRACDHGAAESGADYFDINLPDRPYRRADRLSSGDIVRSTAEPEPEPEPTIGQLTVAAVTSGWDLDPDGYTVTVDGVTSLAVPANGSVTFSELVGGDHSVTLSGVAPNCTVGGAHPRTVTVPAGGTASTTFDVACASVATRLVFLVQPSDAATYATIRPPVEVVAVNDAGARVSSFTGAVSIAIGRNGGLLLPGRLSGTKTVYAVDGVATFSDLSIGSLGTYTLRTSSPGLESAESESFDIGLGISLGLGLF